MSDKRKTSYDLDETIQFTQDELRRLRQPNKQPIDDDYFSRDLHRGEMDLSGETVEQLDIMPRKISPSAELDVVEDEVVQVESEIKEETNPFLYQSKSNELRQEKEQKKRELEEKARAKKEFLSRKMDELYEPVYDEYELEDLESYNQFDSEENYANEMVEEEPILSRTAKAASVKQEQRKPRINVGQWFSKASEQVKSKITELKDKTQSHAEMAEEDTEVLEMSEEPVITVDTELVPEESVQDIEPLVEEVSQQEELEIADFQENVNELPVEDTDDTQIEEISLDNEDSAIVDELSAQVTESTQYFEEPILTDKVLDEVLGHDDIQIEELAEEQVSFVKGTAWLTVGNLISRILGALYVIPWATWLGAEFTNANALYSVGYRPYSLFLAISTAGFPSAIAKQMAYYNARKEYKVADKLFKNSLMVMGVTGLISALLLFLSAPFIAYNSATDTPEAAIVVIRSLAPALLILPVMSLLRGYFQGFGDMVPTAVSQILEQIARVVYLLVATYAIMQLLSGNVTSAVAHSTFAAFIGALLSLLYLVIVYLKRRPLIQILFERSEDTTELDFKTSMKLLLVDSVPFILLGSGIIIAQMVDLFSFRQILETTTIILSSDIKVMYGTMSHDVDKLIMIVISVAIGMSLSSIPLITSLYANAEVKKTAQLIERISIVFLIFMLPAALGMASIADNMYQLFYANGSEQGPGLLVTASYLSIILGAYTVLSTILQSMNYRRLAIKYLFIGLLVKVVLQFPLVALFHAHGALASTLVAFLVTSCLMLWKIHQLVSLDFKAMLPDTVIIFTASVLMALSAGFWNISLNALFGPVGRLFTFIKIIVIVLFAAMVYGGVLALFGKLSLVIGNKYQTLQEKLRLF
ncbi:MULTISPECIES: polysaccharide biosynthesis protein [unclassified Facklamia]|uniref:putative polysaccharide biosynthesis protein n=1 Tax=Aerococcaceae TaxID=186827 RepID=UPI0013B95438|nr:MULTISPECIES: polysaccharide biosynthesis protein [unclassified Facklamia]NEW64842.1 oligosaccharide flippase family protein [Facklamia sp. 252]NEW68164.1 oligosaccharide flippase family protein [Facklamia sp. 253]QQD66011.1 oligosaccharide flippase family protein [Aerococcaceae bacterium zg-252]